MYHSGSFICQFPGSVPGKKGQMTLVICSYDRPLRRCLDIFHVVPPYKGGSSNTRHHEKVAHVIIAHSSFNPQNKPATALMMFCPHNVHDNLIFILCVFIFVLWF